MIDKNTNYLNDEKFESESIISSKIDEILSKVSENDKMSQIEEDFTTAHNEINNIILPMLEEFKKELKNTKL